MRDRRINWKIISIYSLLRSCLAFLVWGKSSFFCSPVGEILCKLWGSVALTLFLLG